MTYFSKFGTVDYDFSTTKKPEIHSINDLMTRVSMTVANRKTVKVLFDPYIIQDLDKPEIISHTLYGTPYYHWTIMYVNNMTNMRTDWPLSAVQFTEYMYSKYGTEEAMYATKYWRTEGGIIGDYDYLYAMMGKTPVMITHYDWEVEQNERKRQILVVSPKYINAWATQFMSKIQ